MASSAETTLIPKPPCNRSIRMEPSVSRKERLYPLTHKAKAGERNRGTSPSVCKGIPDLQFPAPCEATADPRNGKRSHGPQKRMLRQR